MDEFMKYKVAMSARKRIENTSQAQVAWWVKVWGAGMGLGMGFMMPQMIQQSMMSGKLVTAEGKETAMDKLKKLKELLDMEIISQQEFDEKKSKLMDLI